MVIKMKMKNILENFLYDKKYFITMFDDYIHIYRFNKLLKLSNNEIVLSINNFIYKIIGENLFIKQMTKDEILIKGIVKETKKEYE